MLTLTFSLSLSLSSPSLKRTVECSAVATTLNDFKLNYNYLALTLQNVIVGDSRAAVFVRACERRKWIEIILTLALATLAGCAYDMCVCLWLSSNHHSVNIFILVLFLYNSHNRRHELKPFASQHSPLVIYEPFFCVGGLFVLFNHFKFIGIRHQGPIPACHMCRNINGRPRNSTYRWHSLVCICIDYS